MKRLTPFLLCSVLLWACSEAPENNDTEIIDTDSTTETSEINYQPFPSGYGYMEYIDSLELAVETKDMAYIRDHAWKLWAGIMQPAEGLEWPVWYTWENTYGAFASGVDMDEIAIHLKGHSLITQNQIHTSVIMDSTMNDSLPYYPIPQAVIEAYKDYDIFPVDTATGDTSISIGKHFMFNGDIMVPTESLSEEAFNWIRGDTLYEQSRLNELYNDNVHQLDAPQQHIVTKHMYWPVPAEGVSALPVWNPEQFAVNGGSYEDYDGYGGYERWHTLVGIDPSGMQVGHTVDLTYLYGVFENKNNKTTPIEPVSGEAMVYGLDNFYYHKITQEDWDSFDEADKAILNASSYWAHNKPLGVGDYIITVAMHINTKEIPTWALQSVWWSDKPDDGKYSENKPDIPQAIGPWYHYLMVDAYGVVPDGKVDLPIAMNPYIELVIHPIQTNCNNCHSRAGWPTGDQAGFASYQNPDCLNLLEKLNPDTSPCLAKYLLTDFQWIIPDHARESE